MVRFNYQRSTEQPLRGKTTVAVPIVLSRWVTDLLPRFHRWAILTAAAIVGSRTDGRAVTLGQLVPSDVVLPMHALLRFTNAEMFRLREWGLDACMTEVGSIIRTAIHVGLDLPYATAGVLDITRTTCIRKREWKAIVEASGVVIEETGQHQYLTQGNDSNRIGRDPRSICARLGKQAAYG